MSAPLVAFVVVGVLLAAGAVQLMLFRVCALGMPRIKDDPPLIFPPTVEQAPGLETSYQKAIALYREFPSMAHRGQ